MIQSSAVSFADANPSNGTDAVEEGTVTTSRESLVWATGWGAAALARWPVRAGGGVAPLGARRRRFKLRERHQQPLRWLQSRARKPPFSIGGCMAAAVDQHSHSAPQSTHFSHYSQTLTTPGYFWL
jgi:hypothetical protein